MAEISLNASMRSNLLSLQQTQRLQDTTQSRLSTGLKVNSAIDNPSSYYTASSLNNRAEDLGALLDAMSQGIQTIKAANEALETGTAMLQQAKAFLSQSIDNPPLIEKEKEQINYTGFSKLDKSWYEGQIGANDAVVSTAAELKTAIAANKSTIVIYGNIDFTNEKITLNANQKLVGTEYFADKNQNALYRPSNEQKFSSLIFNNSSGNAITINKNGCEISDLTINSNLSVNGSTVIVSGSGIKASINNIDVNYKITNANSAMKGAICSNGGATLDVFGQNNILMSSTRPDGRPILTWGLYASNTATLNLFGTANVTCNQNNNDASLAMVAYLGSTLNIHGTLNAQNCQYLLLAGNKFSYGDYTNNTINIKASAKLNGAVVNLFNIGTSNTTPNILNFEKGSRIYWHNLKNPSEHKAWEISSNQTHKNSFTKKINEELKVTNIFDDFNYQLDLSVSERYASILSQYDLAIKDSSYKGVNLLLEQSLQINFNEERSSKVNINGVDASTKGLGLSQREIKTSEDLDKSLVAVQNAVNQLRSFSAEFGNYYSIVTTREDFTENLINVLTEGADKLTLADMNAESANMLALQTRQQLAINSLSLASQAAQSVLKLF